MMMFLLASQNIPFMVAITSVFIICMLEGAGALLGAGFSDLLESLFPGLDMDIDGPELVGVSAIQKALGWINIGRMPLLIWLVIALTVFGLVGLLSQMFVFTLAGSMMPTLVGVCVATVISIPGVRLVTTQLASIMPKEETSAVSLDTLVGRVAKVTLGKATHHQPTRAKVTDKFNHCHYILLAPDVQSDSFERDDDILIVRREGALFYGVKVLNTHLLG